MNNIRYTLIVLVLVKSILCLNYIQCNNKSLNRTSKGCCTYANGNELEYDRSVKVCCGNKLHHKSKDKSCCIHKESEKSEIYEIRKQICCNGKVAKRSDISNTECCGTETYNKKSAHCLLGSIILSINESFCSGIKYNRHKDHCCNGRLTGQKTKDGVICCGHKFVRIGDCCDGEMHVKDNNEKCCGKTVINKNMSCCNGKGYNPKLNSCIGGNIADFNPNTCNSKPYNSKTQICCGYDIIYKTENNQDSCCQGSLGLKIPYDSTKQNCTNKGDIQSTISCTGSVDPKKYTCCQGLQYNKPSNESMCCKNIQKEKPAEGIPVGCQPSLCGNEIYNGKYNICCNGKLISRTKYYCKNGKMFKLFNFKDGLYTKDIQICGQYAIKKSRIIGCCVGMPYFKNKIKCPLKWRDKRNELKPSDYPFWNIIQCKTLNMIGTILHVISISQNKFTIRFESDDKIYTVEISVRNPSKKKILMRKSVNKKIYVFYEKILGNEIILGTYGTISFAKNHSIKKIDKTKCQQFENYRK